MLSETFWVAFISTASAMIIKLASLCFKSKCSECIICGGRIRVIRDIDVCLSLDMDEVPESDFFHTIRQTWEPGTGRGWVWWSTGNTPKRLL